MKNILIYGSHGYIGSEFSRQIQERGWGFSPCGRGLGCGPWLDSSFENVVVNCAAFVCKPSVDLNDENKEETFLANLAFPAQLAAICETFGVPLLHVSTGCLFNGAPPAIFNELDEPMLTLDKGAGAYVASKELAERVVRRYEKHWICRTRLPFDNLDHPRNFLSKLLAYPKILDTYNSLSHRGDFVKACLDIIELGVPYGTFNCTNGGALWTHDIAAALVEARLKDKFEYWNWDDFVRTRKTPMSNCELDNSKLLASGVKMRSVHEAVQDSINNWRKQ